MNEPPNNDGGTPPDLSSRIMTHHQFRREMKRIRRLNRRRRPFYRVAAEDTVRYIKRFNWKSGLGFTLIGCGTVCGGYWIFCVDGGSTIVTAAGAIGGYLTMQSPMQPFNDIDPMNDIDIDVHQNNRSLLSSSKAVRSRTYQIEWSDDAWKRAIGDPRAVKDGGGVGADSFLNCICRMTLGKDIDDEPTLRDCRSHLTQRLQEEKGRNLTDHSVHHSPWNFVKDWMRIQGEDAPNVVLYRFGNDGADKDLLVVHKTFLIAKQDQIDTKVLAEVVDAHGVTAWKLIDPRLAAEWVDTDEHRAMGYATNYEGGRNAPWVGEKLTKPENQPQNKRANIIRSQTEDFVMRLPQLGEPQLQSQPQPQSHRQPQAQSQPQPQSQSQAKSQSQTHAMQQQNSQMAAGGQPPKKRPNSPKKKPKSPEPPSQHAPIPPIRDDQNESSTAGSKQTKPQSQPQPRPQKPRQPIVSSAPAVQQQNSSGGAGPPSDSPDPPPESPPQPRPVQNARIPPPRTQRRDAETQTSSTGHRGEQRPSAPAHEAQPKSLRNSQGNGGQPSGRKKKPKHGPKPPKTEAPPNPTPPQKDKKRRAINMVIVGAVFVLLLSVPAACICIGLMIWIWMVQRRRANSAAMNHDAGEPPVADMV